MPKFLVESEDGRTFEIDADRKPTNEEAEQIISSQGQQQAPGFFGTDPIPEAPQSSPLSFEDRVTLSFSDPATKREILADRFKFVQDLPNGKLAVGNNIKNMAPIDPEGLFNDVAGDLADIASIIPPIAGQIAGAAAGIPGGPPGVIAGGAAGAAVGELVSKGIGKGLGVNAQDAGEVATDVLISATFGALGEGIGLGLKAAGPLMAKAGAKAYQAVVNRNPLKKEFATNVLAKTLKMASNVDPDATRTVMKFGADDIFTKFNSTKSNVVRVADDVVEDITRHRAVLGNQLGTAIDNLGAAGKKRSIQAGAEVKGFLDELVNNDLLTPDFKLNRQFITDGSDMTIFKKVLSQLEVKPSISGATVTFKSNFTPREIVGLRRQLSAKFDNLSANSSRLVSKFRQGLSGKLDEFAKETGNLDFIAANQKFAQFAQEMDKLKSAGVNLDKPSNVASFIEGFFKKSEVAKAALNNIDSQTPLPILERITKFASAQEFQGASPNILRFGFILALFGYNMQELPGGKLGAVGLAILTGTPAGNRVLLKAGQRLTRGIPLRASLPKNLFGDPQAARRALTALLSQTARPRQDSRS